MKITLLIVGAVFCFALASASDISRMVARAKETAGKGGKKEEAKCNCDDPELWGGLLGTIGNVVVACETARLWSVLDTVSGGDKRQGGYDFYTEACDFVGELGKKEEEEDEEEVHSCNDVKQGLFAFHCLNTYMSLAEINYVRNELEGKADTGETAEHVQFLEHLSKAQCDAQYHSPTCLVMGMTEDPEQENCANPQGGDEPARSMNLREKIRRLLVRN